MERRVRGVTDEAMKRLESYSWPGNIRELENRIKRAMVLSREDILSEYLFEMEEIQLADMDKTAEEQLSGIARRYLIEASSDPRRSGAIFDETIGIVEKTLIEEALQRTGGNQVQAAQLLGMNRSTLRKKKKDYGL